MANFESTVLPTEHFWLSLQRRPYLTYKPSITFIRMIQLEISATMKSHAERREFCTGLRSQLQFQWKWDWWILPKGTIQAVWCYWACWPLGWYISFEICPILSLQLYNKSPADTNVRARTPSLWKSGQLLPLVMFPWTHLSSWCSFVFLFHQVHLRILIGNLIHHLLSFRDFLLSVASLYYSEAPLVSGHLHF